MYCMALNTLTLGVVDYIVACKVVIKLIFAVSRATACTYIEPYFYNHWLYVKQVLYA